MSTAPYLNLQLLQLLLYQKESQDKFRSNLSARSEISIADAPYLLRQLSDERFFSFHHNQTRHCKEEAFRFELNQRGMKRGVCVFTDNGCLQTSTIIRAILRHHPISLEEIELYAEYDDSVQIHSSDVLNASNVVRRRAYGTRRYVIAKGYSESKPAADSAMLRCATDRCLDNCILFALDTANGRNSESVYMRVNADIFAEAQKLKETVVDHS